MILIIGAATLRQVRLSTPLTRALKSFRVAAIESLLTDHTCAYRTRLIVSKCCVHIFRQSQRAAIRIGSYKTKKSFQKRHIETHDRNNHPTWQTWKIPPRTATLSQTTTRVAAMPALSQISKLLITSKKSRSQNQH